MGPFQNGSEARTESLRATAFDSWPEPALVLDPLGRAVAVNEAAEQLFGAWLSNLRKKTLGEALPPGSPIAQLIERCLQSQTALRERDTELVFFNQAPLPVDAAATPLADGEILLTLNPRSPAPGVDRAGEGAGFRSVMGLGQMLAHEVKNPLAGIRGAAQLLKTAASAEDMPLAQLIVDETDRIRRLVDRMEALADDAAPERREVNIHQVLDRVKALVANGVADGLVLRDHYDPSLPPAWGDEDHLIQIFLNLTKNAAEAAHARGDARGEIVIATAYRHGVKIRGKDGRVGRAPLEVRIIDNGPGVPRKLREHLFEPFVTTKAAGAGLGLALVAKLVAAHDGLIDFESEPGRTVFRVLLPAAPAV